VRRTGRGRLPWRSVKVNTTCINSHFLQGAIFHYLQWPAEQPSIGTGDNYRRMLHALGLVEHS